MMYGKSKKNKVLGKMVENSMLKDKMGMEQKNRIKSKVDNRMKMAKMKAKMAMKPSKMM